MTPPTRLCPSCETPVPEGSLSCPSCGTATPTEIRQETATPRRTNAAGADEIGQRSRLQRALGENFAVGRLLGRGGFAEVYAALDVKLKRPVAVKVLHPDLVLSPTLIERFLREAQAVAKLRHPSIIPIYQVGEGDGLAYYIMPLIDGESLRSCLEREGALPIAEARRILGEVAEALDVAHAAGIVHRDIKPDNIMLDGRERRAMVTDFGIAKALGSGEAGLTGTGMLVGTPQYMSPEQASGEKHIDARSDIYSLGCVAYQMLAGRMPFEGDSAQAMIVAHIAASPEPVWALRSDVPDDLGAAVMRALAKRPEERWSTAGAFAAAVRGVGPGSGPAPAWRLPHQVRSGARWLRRSVRASLAGLVLLVVGVAVAGGPAARAVRNHRERPLRAAADAGIELGRAALNETPALFPDSGYFTLQANQPVSDASGNPIPNVTRSIYLGPTASSTGQAGGAAGVIAVINGRDGPVLVRRGALTRESFGQYDQFTSAQHAGICFGGGEQIQGPMYSNSDMCIYSSGARFRDKVEVTGTITGIQYGTFDRGYVQHGAPIPLPSAAALAKLATYATAGGTSFMAPAGGTSTQSRLRIEFLALDLDGDGRVTGPTEGFFRVYQGGGAGHADYVTGTAPRVANTSRNCGDFHTVGGVTTFYSAAYHLNPAHPLPGGSITHAAHRGTAAAQSLQVANARCFLGGDEHLTVVLGRNTFVAADSLGSWMRYTATPDPAVIAGLKHAASRAVDTSLAARTLAAQYLWPLSRQRNPTFRDVIYVSGRVVVSGVVRGRVTLAASDNVIIADDLTYAIRPDSLPCSAADMLGLLSSATIYMADNVLNSPQPWGASGEFKTYGSTADEFVQGVLLTLNAFTAENYAQGATAAEPCGTRPTGRGCLYKTGGLIQSTRGAVGTTAGTGYWKRYTFDRCAAEAPPPHFPTTGRFFGTRNYDDVAPTGFDVASFFRAQAPRQ